MRLLPRRPGRSHGHPTATRRAHRRCAQTKGSRPCFDRAIENAHEKDEAFADLPTIAYVILGMIDRGQDTGYRITSTVAGSVRHFYAASDGQVYPWLRRLVERGLAEVHAEHQGARTRLVHSLTPDGRAVLMSWLRSDLTPAYEMRDEGLLKLLFSDGLGVEAQRALLERLAERHAHAALALEAVRPFSVAPAGELTLRLGIDRHRWEHDWFIAARDALDSDADGS